MNLVVLRGTVVADPVQRRMPSGDTLLELRVKPFSDGDRRRLPLPVVVNLDTHAGAVELEKGDTLEVRGELVRRFYRSGAGARSLTEVAADYVGRTDA